jgi:dihydroorotase-like cyclic amidohydrolase
MPNTSPVLDSAEAIENLVARAETADITVLPYGR